MSDLTPFFAWFGFGHSDPAFRDWVHAEKGDTGGLRGDDNYTKKQLDKFRKEYDKAEKKPRGKGGKSGKGGQVRGQKGFATPGIIGFCTKIYIGAYLLLTPSPVACSELPENCEKRKQEQEQENDE